jgi:predicted unusual protein kinase regulating ubiquinone biosynthesis (AarF/ABC1/UbiB family)
VCGQSNLDRFRVNFRSNHDVIFPEPLRPLVNELVLVEDYVSGTPMSEILKVGALVFSK